MSALTYRTVLRHWRRWVSRRRRSVSSIRLAHRAYWATVIVGLVAVFGGSMVMGTTERLVRCARAMFEGSNCAGDIVVLSAGGAQRNPVLAIALGVIISVCLLRAVHGLVVASFFVPRVRRRRRAEGDTHVVVTFVHGTFAPDAPWTHEDAMLPRELLRQFQGHCSIYTLDWSGENNHYARMRAAQALQRHLARIGKLCPGIPHVIVAHSHGGNVAMYAQRDHTDHVAGIVTLSTPFIQVRERAAVNIPAFGSSLPLALLACAGGALTTALLASLVWTLTERVLGTGKWWVAAGMWIATTILLARWWKAASIQLRKQLQFETIDPSRCLLVRTPGDEAGAVLMMLPLASVLMHLAGQAVITLGNAPLRLRDALRRAYVRHRDARLRVRWILVYMLAFGALVLGFEALTATESRIWRLVLPALVLATLAIVSRYRKRTDDPVQRMRTTQQLVALGAVLLIAASCWAVPAQDVSFSIGMAIAGALLGLIPLPILWLLTRFAVIIGRSLQVVTATAAHFVAALAALPFGIDLLPAILHFDLTAENTPVGEWTTRSAYIPPNASRGKVTPGGVAAVDAPLMHSRAYSDPAVCFGVSDFVKARRDWWNSDQRARRTAEREAIARLSPLTTDMATQPLAVH